MTSPRSTQRSSSSSIVRRTRPSRPSRPSRGTGLARGAAPGSVRLDERTTLPTWSDEQIDELIDQALSARPTLASLDDTLLEGPWAFVPPPSTSRRTTVPVFVPAGDQARGEGEGEGEGEDDDADAPTQRDPSSWPDEAATLRNPEASAAALKAFGLDVVLDRATLPSPLAEGAAMELDEADLFDVVAVQAAASIDGSCEIEIEVVFEEQLEELDAWDELPPSLPAHS